MELHQVRYFLALASTLNFTRAAEMCNITQPALTKGVQKLERELGGQLIYRERQLTHLTDLGKAVLPMLERTLASTEAVRRRALEFRQKQVAPLVIGLAPSISASLVLEPIAEIRKFVPGLHVELREEPPNRLVELLLEGDINVALIGDFDNKPERIDDWALFEERYVAVLAPSHELANLPVIGIDALRAATILNRINCDVAAKFHRLFFPDAPPRHNHRSSRDLHLQHLAAAGFGIILAPEHMPRLPSLKALPIEGDPVRREVRLLAVQGRRYSPALDAFVKVARLRDWSRHTGSSLQSDHRSTSKQPVCQHDPAYRIFLEMPGVQMKVELISDRLTKSLAQVRNEIMAGFSDADRDAYTHLVDWLRKTKIASHALRVGDTAPDFLLPDAYGQLHSSEHLRSEGPLVVSFYRGGWCPFCNAQLRALQAVKDEFDSLKANLVALSPETRDLPRLLKRQLNLDLTMLADVDHGVAMSYGVLFRVPDETKAHYAALGYDFGRRHGLTEWMLPIPVTYVIDQEGVVRGAFVEPDFTIRQEPSDILATVRHLAGPHAEDVSESGK